VISLSFFVAKRQRGILLKPREGLAKKLKTGGSKNPKRASRLKYRPIGMGL
jgi:hypothetical protein